MLTAAAPVVKAAPQGAWRALGLGRVAGASRNQKRTAYPSGKYDFFGCTQHSFCRWLKRGLRGNFVVLMMLILLMKLTMLLLLMMMMMMMLMAVQIV
jgi:hypothetical protein